MISRPGLAAAVAATRVGTSDVYQATVDLATPAAGTAYTLEAVISDASP